MQQNYEQMNPLFDYFTAPFLINISALEVGKQIRTPDVKWVEQLAAAMEDYLDEAYQPLIVVLKNETKENFNVTIMLSTFCMLVSCFFMFLMSCNN